MTRQLYYDDVSEGDALPTLEKTPSTRQLVMYAGASGDFYEIHYDQAFAQARGLPNVIVHGALKSAFLAQLVTDWMGEQGTLKRLSVQYRGMDAAGQPMYCNGVVTGKRVEGTEHLAECDIWTENGSGDKTTRGSALVSLPARPA
jgi:acyl dehydratase